MGKRYRDIVRQHSKAKGSRRALLNVLADYAGDDGIAWPGNETLANDCGMSERTIIRCVQQLVKDGEIEVVDGGRGPGHLAKYRILTGPKGDSLSLLPEEKVTTGQPKGDKLSPEKVTSTTLKGDNLSLPIYEPDEPDLEPKEAAAASAAPAAVPVASASRDSPAWTAWTANMPGTLTPALVDSIEELLSEYTEWEFVRAITIACERQNRTLSYVRGILRKGVDSQPPPANAAGNGYVNGKDGAYHGTSRNGSTPSGSPAEDAPALDPAIAQRFEEHRKQRARQAGSQKPP